MKDILLWDQRFPDRHPRRLSVDDSLASAMVRSGAAAPLNQADFAALNVGGPLDPATPTEIVVEDGFAKRMRRVIVPVSVAAIAVSLGIGAPTEMAVTPAPGPAPAPTITQPSISPSNGTAGVTIFTGTDGTPANGIISAREWLLNGSVVATGGVFAPTAAQTGALTYRNIVTGPGGSASNLSTTVTISAGAQALLAGNRFAPMGNAAGSNGDGLSNGVNVNSNSRLSWYNLTGADITEMQAVMMNWADNGNSETSGVNPITYETAIEYPAGTITRITHSGGQTAYTAGVDTTPLSDRCTVPTIPKGAQAWVRTWVSVPPGGKFPMGYVINTSLGEATDWDTGVNKVMGGAITHATSGAAQRGFGPAALLATGVNGTRKAKAWCGLGDSIMNGTKSATDFGGNIGWLGNAMWLVGLPYINISRPSARADLALANFTKRAYLMSVVGVTDTIGNYGVNDLSNNRTAAQLAADMTSLGNLVSAMGIRFYPCTITPNVKLSGVGYPDPAGYFTGASQTPNVGGTSPVIGPNQFVGGSNSERGKYNAWLRTNGNSAPFSGYLEAADAVEPSRDAGIWLTGSDAAAPVNLMKPTIGGVVQAGSTTSVVQVAVGAGANTVVNGGVVVFRAGANAGTTKFGASNTATSITLTTALASAPAAGDTVDIYPYGCAPVDDGLHPRGYNNYALGGGVPSYGAAAILAQVGKAFLQANN